MYARRQTRPKPRKSRSVKFDAPTAGWIANRNLSDPRSLEGPGAAILDNYFPKSSSVKLRRGKQLYATLGDGSHPVLSIFSYVNGANQKLFAANESTIYNITSVVFPYGWEIVTEDDDLIITDDMDWFGADSTEDLDVAGGYTGGNWIVVQFATSGGVYLVGVNGQDDGFIFDGQDFWPNVAGGVTVLNVDGATGDFLDGELVTGGTSGATGTILRAVEGSPGVLTLYLVGVDGTFEDNEAVTSDGTGEGLVNGAPGIAAPGVTFPDGLTSADMSYVWAYKNRLWFAQKDSMTAWYLDIDSIGGDASSFPLAGIFGRGGTLLFGSGWSLDSGGDGGLSEQCIFVSSEGEVAVFQGGDPDTADDWRQVGVYRIGKPLGNRAHFRGGGDIAIATTVGLVPLSKAISLDVTSLSVASVSLRIADAWSDAVAFRTGDWQCEVWPDQKMAIVAPPLVEGGGEPVMFVANTETGAWARFTGWHGICLEVFQGTLFFAGNDGKIWIGNVGGNDEGEVFTGTVVPLFVDLDSPASSKIGKVARAVTRANGEVNGSVELLVDYEENRPPSPDATSIGGENAWGTAIWGQAVWGAQTPQRINQRWQSVGGIGYALSVCYQVSSGSVIPLDDELIRMDLTYETAELVS